MTGQARKIKEKLNMVTVNTDELNGLLKDRLDFGFDSIYFRYATLCDELAAYKAVYEHKDPVKVRKSFNYQKECFYKTLEQLVQAHKED